MPRAAVLDPRGVQPPPDEMVRAADGVLDHAAAAMPRVLPV
eukprot:SAG22_NODE_9982_length_560_cov_0.947939_2_plen_40_part_01